MTERTIDSGAPLVTVVTPCHNAVAYVGETIESVLKQTHAAVEHVVVDDGSTDGSWEVIRGWAERHPERIRAERVEENRGGSHARNLGAAEARGEYLMFLDADDLISPETVGSLVEAARGEPGAVAVCEWRRLRQEEGEWVATTGEVPLPETGEDHLRYWLEGRWVPTCSVLWPRDVYEGTGGWDEELRGNDDGDLMMRGLAGGARLVRAKAGTGYYRIHGDASFSLSSGMHFSAATIRDFVRVLEKLEAQLGRTGRMQEYGKSLGIAYYRLPVVGFLETEPDLAREILARGERLAGREAAPEVALGRTLPGRILSRVMGVERKERLLRLLGRVGLMTRERREYMERRARFEHTEKADPPPPVAILLLPLALEACSVLAWTIG